MTYPAHYHAAVNALVRDSGDARRKLARSLRLYRQAGERTKARDLLHHAAWLGYPVRRRPSGRRT